MFCMPVVIHSDFIITKKHDPQLQAARCYPFLTIFMMASAIKSSPRLLFRLSLLMTKYTGIQKPPTPRLNFSTPFRNFESSSPRERSGSFLTTSHDVSSPRRDLTWIRNPKSFPLPQAIKSILSFPSSLIVGKKTSNVPNLYRVLMICTTAAAPTHVVRHSAICCTSALCSGRELPLSSQTAETALGFS